MLGGVEQEGVGHPRVVISLLVVEVEALRPCHWRGMQVAVERYRVVEDHQLAKLEVAELRLVGGCGRGCVGRVVPVKVQDVVVEEDKPLAWLVGFDCEFLGSTSGLGSEEDQEEDDEDETALVYEVTHRVLRRSGRGCRANSCFIEAVGCAINVVIKQANVIIF